MLPAASHAALVVSRRGRLLLAVTAAVAFMLPTVYLSRSVAATQAANNADGEQKTTAADPPENNAADSQPARATLTGGAVATLPGKAVVEMIGVGEHPSTGKAWWAPDGAPIVAPYEKVRMNIRGADNEIMREIAMRIIEPPGTHVETLVRFNSSNGQGQPLDAKGKTISSVRVSAGGFLPLQATCTVEIAVATGPWKTVTQTGGRNSGSVGLASGQGFQFAPAYEQGTATLITIAYHGVDGELRVTAVDAAGSDIIGDYSAIGSGRFSRLTTTKFAHAALKDIVEFRVQTRPVQNFEVRDISLRPGQLTVPKLVEIEPKPEANDNE